MIGHTTDRVKDDNIAGKNFIVVWVGDNEIGAIFPLMCPMDEVISFGPDFLSDEQIYEQKDFRTSGYQVVKLNPRRNSLHGGIDTL
jgi:hypothetical protein